MVAGDSQSSEVLTLGLGGEIFAIDANIVREILDMVPWTRVPGARAYVGGLINVRGRVAPLADLRIKFGMDVTPPTIDSRIVVVEIDVDGEATVVGLLADKVYEVTTLSGASIEHTPDVGMRWRPEYIKGIGKRGADFIVVPDMVRIFSDY
jgi:purine-binding chemotaxis protein CheW